MRMLISLLTLVAALDGFPALAQPVAAAAAEPDTVQPAPEFTAGDWVASFLLADAGIALGVGIGFAWGYDLADSCPDPADLCPLRALGPIAVGSLLIAPTTSAGLVTAYGDARGHRGSYWGALGGAYTGVLAAGLVFAVVDDDTDPAGWIAAATLPALGSALGYYLSRDTSPRRAPTSGALLDLGRDGVVRIGVPNVALAQTDEATVVTLTLLGGAL